MTTVRFKTSFSGAELKAALAADRAADAVADAIVAGLEQLDAGLGLHFHLRHLAGQVHRQRALPRDRERDDRFLLHLEQALRDLSIGEMSL